MNRESRAHQIVDVLLERALVATEPEDTGSVVNTDFSSDAEEVDDPFINRWWYARRLRSHIFPFELLPNGNHRCKVVYRNREGQTKVDVYDLPHSWDWTETDKPSF